MEIKLELPGELRERIQTFLTNLDEALHCLPENETTLKFEISNLETDAGHLEVAIGRLQQEAVSSDTAAATLSAKRTRLIQVNERLEKLRHELISLKPLKLYGAGSVIQDVVGFYVEKLPDAIADFLVPICSSRHKALGVVKFCDAYSVLGGIRSWGDSVNLETANTSNVGQLKDILQRALRGQAHLGVDAPAKEGAQ